jgi:hypothetical protein
MTISEILSGGMTSSSSKPPTIPKAKYSVASAIDYMMSTTPTKMTKAEKFNPSPTKPNQERYHAMNHR